MQKYLEILENKVEWIALGLAGLWVAFMAWSYWATAPVTIEVAGEHFGPGEVDSFVEKEKTTLEARINDPAPPKIPQPPDFVGEFTRSMQPRVPQAMQFVAGIIPSPPPLQKIDARQSKPLEPTKVADLPKPVKILMTGTSSGRSQVVMEEAPPLDPALLNALNPQGTPAVVPPPAPVPAIPAVPVAVDRSWITTGGGIPAAKIIEAFVAAGIPEDLQMLDYLEVQLERCEASPDGKPIGKPVLIAPLPKDAPPPQADKRKNEELFVVWASIPANQERILRPVFYRQMGGDPWVPPGAPQAIVAQAPVLVDPMDRDPSTMTAEELFAHIQALPTQADKNKFFAKLTTKQKGEVTRLRLQEEEKNRPRPQPKTPTTPRRERGERNQAHDPRVIGEMYAQTSGGAYIPGGPPVTPPPGTPVYAPARPIYAPAPVVAGLDPNLPAGIIPIWAHDETVESGKTYVYRIRVVIRNPMHKQANLVTKPALAEQLELVQEWSDWSTPVTIATSMEMQFAGTVLNREQVRFKVWKWQNGALNGPKEFVAGPGDMIGGVDKSPTPPPAAGVLPGTAQAVDYSTGWTVVDVRRTGSNDFRAVMVNEEGRTKTVYMNADLANPKYKKLEPPTPPAAAVGG